MEDALCAIDYLLTRPEVDQGRIGATGLGAGGALTLYTAALDDRVQGALISSYLAKYLTTSLDETHCSCCDVPRILHYAEMGDVAALIAPRPVIYVNGQRDPSSSAAARESFATVSHMVPVLGRASARPIDRAS